ncbi:MAG: hypothetical protein QM783_17485 [Phycisphaerales bacterium]
MRWIITISCALTIACLLAVAFMGASTAPNPLAFWAVMSLLIVLLLCGIVTQWAQPSAAKLAWRGVGAIIFVAYFAYVVVEILSPTPNQQPGPGSATLSNAIKGFCLFGIPSLLLMIKGPPRRLLYPSWRAEELQKLDADERTAEGLDAGGLAKFRQDAFKRPDR